jgi:hypothetical protein
MYQSCINVKPLCWKLWLERNIFESKEKWISVTRATVGCKSSCKNNARLSRTSVFHWNMVSQHGTLWKDCCYDSFLAAATIGMGQEAFWHQQLIVKDMVRRLLSGSQKQPQIFRCVLLLEDKRGLARSMLQKVAKIIRLEAQSLRST